MFENIGNCPETGKPVYVVQNPEGRFFIERLDILTLSDWDGTWEWDFFMSLFNTKQEAIHNFQRYFQFVKNNKPTVCWQKDGF